MTLEEQDRLLALAKTWFVDVLMKKHEASAKKLSSLKKFKINPFLHSYLAHFYAGEATADSMARVLLLPRVLGTSINTSFGTQIQKFMTQAVKEVLGSRTDGIDVEFVDAVTGKTTLCQLKLGPNTINKDDVETIRGHFKKGQNLARTNHAGMEDVKFAIGVMYGSESDLSSHYKKLRSEFHYDVFVGSEFWYRLTGAKDFYDRLVAAFSEVSVQANGKQLMNDVAAKLAKQIKL